MKEMIIDFPAQNDTQNEKLVRLLQDLQDCLNTEIGIETISILRVKYDGNRAEIGSILQRLAGNKTGLRQITTKRYSNKIKPLRMIDDNIDKSIDPLGS